MGKADPPPPLRPAELATVAGGAAAGGAMAGGARARNELDKIIFTGDEIHFGFDYTFSASTPTAFASKQSGRPYPLSAAVFLAPHHNLKHTDFIQATRLRCIPYVSLPDRKTFLDFLRFGHNSPPSAF
ncbi:unnamed protein product [Miscanthus lutarioriparius]|uniref:Paf1 complex subunit Cdc73 N-terminal domain-containing protein n=1 Tax=Miscanthus lutarioriparius TaxID=422564 RepID=A0A811S1L1_9POAL|nr:unnamed protein product [Miscanthus lutarioriparius]